MTTPSIHTACQDKCVLCGGKASSGAFAQMCSFCRHEYLHKCPACGQRMSGGTTAARLYNNCKSKIKGVDKCCKCGGNLH